MFQFNENLDLMEIEIYILESTSKLEHTHTYIHIYLLKKAYVNLWCRGGGKPKDHNIRTHPCEYAQWGTKG